MMNAEERTQIPLHIYSTAEDRDDLLAYWQVYQRRYEEVTRELEKELHLHSELGPIIRGRTVEQAIGENARSLELQRAAIVDGAWETWATDLKAQGIAFARMGLSYKAWFEIVALFRKKFQPIVVNELKHDPTKLISAISGLSKLTELSLGVIGEAYVVAKEGIIGQQEDAIRELSIPVLQVRERLLLLPLIGVLDTHRARLLTQELLKAIRTHRAKAVVMDITGVAAMDSRVANHLLQSIEAARLMGALVVVTGLSADVAQALVALGGGLSRLSAVGDLQEGLEVAERILGYKVSRGEPTLPSISG